MDRNSPIYKKYAQIAAELTKKYGYPVSVVHRNKKSIVPLIAAADDMIVYIITPLDKSEKLIEKLNTDYHRTSKDFEVQITHPAEEFVKLIRTNPEMLRNGLGGMGFITPFMFHTEIIGNYSKGFVEALRTNFGPELNKQIDERIRRLFTSRTRTIHTLRRQTSQANEKRKKLVGQLEQKSFSTQMERMSKEIHQTGSEVLIVVDKSARPLGLPLKKILKNAFGREVEVFFITPEFVKHFKNNPANLKKLLDRENPRFEKAITGKMISIVDDQVFTGKTISQLEKLLRAYNPKSIHSTVLSSREEEISPSWREQQLHHVEENGARRKFISQKAFLTPRETIRLANMRKGLDFVANRVINNLKKRK